MVHFSGSIVAPLLVAAAAAPGMSACLPMKYFPQLIILAYALSLQSSFLRRTAPLDPSTIPAPCQTICIPIFNILNVRRR